MLPPAARGKPSSSETRGVFSWSSGIGGRRSLQFPGSLWLRRRWRRKRRKTRRPIRAAERGTPTAQPTITPLDDEEDSSFAEDVAVGVAVIVRYTVEGAPLWEFEIMEVTMLGGGSAITEVDVEGGAVDGRIGMSTVVLWSVSDAGDDVVEGGGSIIGLSVASASVKAVSIGSDSVGIEPSTEDSGGGSSVIPVDMVK